MADLDPDFSDSDDEPDEGEGFILEEHLRAIEETPLAVLMERWGGMSEGEKMEVDSRVLAALHAKARAEIGDGDDSDEEEEEDEAPPAAPMTEEEAERWLQELRDRTAAVKEIMAPYDTFLLIKEFTTDG